MVYLIRYNTPKPLGCILLAQPYHIIFLTCNIINPQTSVEARLQLHDE